MGRLRGLCAQPFELVLLFTEPFVTGVGSQPGRAAITEAYIIRPFKNIWKLGNVFNKCPRTTGTSKTPVNRVHHHTRPPRIISVNFDESGPQKIRDVWSCS